MPPQPHPERPMLPHIRYILNSGSEVTQQNRTHTLRRTFELLGMAEVDAYWYHYTWSDFSIARFEDLMRILRTEGKAPNTINNYWACVRGCLRQAAQLGYLSHDIVQSIRDEVPRDHGSRVPKPLVPKELIDAMLDHLHAQATATAASDVVRLRAHRDAALVTLLFRAGLRRAEAAGMQRGDLDAGNKLVQITGKGNKQRIIPLPNNQMDLLLNWQLRCLPDDPAYPMFPRIPPTGKKYQLPLPPPPAMTAPNVRVILQRRADEMVVGPFATSARFSPHELRAAYCTEILHTSGGDLRSAQRLLGHESPNTTAMYDRTGMAQLHKVVNRLT